MACAAAVKIVPDIFALGYTARTARWASVDETAKIWMRCFRRRERSIRFFEIFTAKMGAPVMAG